MKENVYFLIIVVLLFFALLAPAIRDEIHSVKECKSIGKTTLCREVYTKVTRPWYVEE